LRVVVLAVGEEGCLPMSSIEKINPMNTCVKFKWIDPSISVGSGPPADYRAGESKLLDFLHQGLNGKGFVVKGPRLEGVRRIAGWELPIENDEFPLAVDVNFLQPNNFCLCSIDPHTSSIRRWFKKIDTTEKIQALAGALDNVLKTDSRVSLIKWSTFDQLNTLDE
jgi:hypothetical protein